MNALCTSQTMALEDGALIQWYLGLPGIQSAYFFWPGKISYGMHSYFVLEPVIHPRLCAKSNLENFEAQS